MTVRFITEEPLSEFLAVVKEELGIEESAEGIPVHLVRHEGGLLVHAKEDGVIINYREKSHLFRGLTAWYSRQGETFKIEETANFESIGPMLDLSRNAVLTVEKLKRFILLGSKMGLNAFMLYMEDTFEIPEYPYFGYSRGRYSQAELKELDDYADMLGVELIPSIQTLAHLTNALKWDYAKEMRDTPDILLVGEPQTYAFVEAMIRSVAACFRTKRVHIGMDEAHDLGRGIYQDKHGYRDRFEIIEEHLLKVKDICDQYGLHAMMWSDMFFRIGSKTGDYYDPDIEFPEGLGETMPAVDMVYWDYYHHELADYQTNLKNHLMLGRPLIFAGGVWTWNGIAPNYGKTIATTIPGLTAAMEYKIPTVFATMWGDDGAETSAISGLLGLQLFAEAQFKEELVLEEVYAQFERFHGLKAEDFLLLDRFDQTEGVVKDNLGAANPSKLALYNDLMYGLYSENLRGLGLIGHYQALAEDLAQVTVNEDTATMFAFYQQLAKTLVLKLQLTEELTDAYQRADKAALTEVKERLPQLVEVLRTTKDKYREMWYQWNKPFGYEVIDMRFGSLISRCETAEWRLKEYLAGNVATLTECDVEKLPYAKMYWDPKFGPGMDFYKHIYSASKLSDV